jgi:hypothetical protein
MTALERYALELDEAVAPYERRSMPMDDGYFALLWEMGRIG